MRDATALDLGELVAVVAELLSPLVERYPVRQVGGRDILEP